jgi:Taurine catabolism dioxygenase TauD, TfdA family
LGALAAQFFHARSDMCYASQPPRGTMLYALEIPELFGLTLGDTEFASTAAAWDALPERMRRHLDGRRAVFDFAGRKRAFPPTQAEIDRYPPVTHPIDAPFLSGMFYAGEVVYAGSEAEAAHDREPVAIFTGNNTVGIRYSSGVWPGTGASG